MSKRGNAAPPLPHAGSRQLSQSPVQDDPEDVVEGFLRKRGAKGIVRGYKRRYFKLFVRRRLLRYFKDETLRAVSDGSGFIDLTDCTAILPAIPAPVFDEALLDWNKSVFDSRIGKGVNRGNSQQSLSGGKGDSGGEGAGSRPTGRKLVAEHLAVPPEELVGLSIADVEKMERNITIVVPGRRWNLRAPDRKEQIKWLAALHAAVAWEPEEKEEAGAWKLEIYPLFNEEIPERNARRPAGVRSVREDSMADHRGERANAPRSSTTVGPGLRKSRNRSILLSHQPPQPMTASASGDAPAGAEWQSSQKTQADETATSSGAGDFLAQQFPRVPYASAEWQAQRSVLTRYLETTNPAVLEEHSEVATIPMFVVRDCTIEDLRERLFLSLEGAEALRSALRNPDSIIFKELVS
jgi:hypothetical protein